MIKITNLKASLQNNLILKGVSFNVEKGDVISIIGPSGAGKTTLLRCMNYLNSSDEGMMEFEGSIYNMNKITKKEIHAIRNKTAFVFQSFNLFRNKTALQNVTEGLIIARKMKKQEANEIGKSLLNKVGLSDKYDSYPEKLSGGQQQRVAIARALATNPDIIYFDEPTSALDPELTNEVLKIIKQLALEKLTMIIVTHELTFAKNVSNKMIFMEDGQIVEENNTVDFFTNPKSPRTKEFISTILQEDL